MQSHEKYEKFNIVVGAQTPENRYNARSSLLSSSPFYVEGFTPLNQAHNALFSILIYETIF